MNADITVMLCAFGGGSLLTLGALWAQRRARQRELRRFQDSVRHRLNHILGRDRDFTEPARQCMDCGMEISRGSRFMPAGICMPCLSARIEAAKRTQPQNQQQELQRP